MDPRIERIFQDVLEDRSVVVTEDSTPANTPGWDSFAQVKLTLAMEEEFGITFTLDEVAGITRAGDFVRVLESRGVDMG
jgi:acyl carrier protein